MMFKILVTFGKAKPSTIAMLDNWLGWYNGDNGTTLATCRGDSEIVDGNPVFNFEPWMIRIPGTWFFLA